MKTKNKPHFLLMACIVAVIAAFTVSCNKDDDPSLADLREDKLQYLEDSLRISDSLRLIGNAGVVNYSITVVDGSTSSIFQNGRTNESQSAIDGAIVTISQYGKTVTDTTDASGTVVFNGFFRSAVNVSIRKTDFTSVSYISGVHIQDSTRTGTISFVGNIIPIFALTGANTATISGRATIQTDLTNRVRENAPDGTKVTAYIDASNNSDFSDKFLTTDIDDRIYVSSCGCEFVYVGNILQASYSTGVIGTVTAGAYSITVPAAVDGLPLTLEYSDVAANQTLYETAGQLPGDRTATYRALYIPFGTISNDIPSGSGVTVTFEAFSVAASATSTVSATSGALDRIEITTPGSGYTGTPLLVIGGTGTGATATATVTNGQISNVTLTSPGTGYTGTPTITILSGTGATAGAATMAQDGTIQSVVINNSGSGYTSAPTVTFSAPTGAGALVTNVTATGTAVITNGRVTSVNITNPGMGYIGNATVTFSAPPAGTTASGTGFYSGESVQDVQVSAPGTNYSYAPSVVFSPPAIATGTRATGVANINTTTRQVTSITITNPGSGYTGAPTVTLSAVGVAATLEPVMAGGSVLSANVGLQGSGYVGTPTVTFVGGGGVGATGTATMVDGKVVGINITSGGTGYTSAPSVVLEAGNGATGFAVVTNGAISGVTVTDGGRNYVAAPRIVLTSSVGGGATATTTATGGAVTGVTMVTGGTGYLEGNTPAGIGAGQGFSATKSTDMETKPGVSYINEIYYGTGLRQPN